jgi:hypothetical protein
MSIARRLLPASLAAAAVGAIAAAALPAAAAGSSQNVKVASFHALDLSGAWTVRAKLGAAPRLKITAEDASDLARVEAVVRGGRLSLGTKRGERLHGDVEAEIWTGSLDAIGISGACKLDAAGLKGNALALDLSGACQATLAGAVKRLTLDASGACQVTAEKLKADDVEVAISGAGSAVVHAVKTLKVDISGMGSVEYLGSPKVTADGGLLSRVRPKR